MSAPHPSDIPPLVRSFKDEADADIHKALTRLMRETSVVPTARAIRYTSARDGQEYEVRLTGRSMAGDLMHLLGDLDTWAKTVHDEAGAESIGRVLRTWYPILLAKGCSTEHDDNPDEETPERRFLLAILNGPLRVRHADGVRYAAVEDELYRRAGPLVDFADQGVVMRRERGQIHLYVNTTRVLANILQNTAEWGRYSGVGDPRAASLLKKLPEWMGRDRPTETLPHRGCRWHHLAWTDDADAKPVTPEGEEESL